VGIGIIVGAIGTAGAGVATGVVAGLLAAGCVGRAGSETAVDQKVVPSALAQLNRNIGAAGHWHERIRLRRLGESDGNLPQGDHHGRDEKNANDTYASNMTRHDLSSPGRFGPIDHAWCADHKCLRSRLNIS
jgi:hypothetical protein